MKLSVILPVYNVEKYVFQCIRSIYMQEMDEKDFEVIVVNDGTPDNSMSVIKPLLSKHSNILILEQENQGVSIARNNGLKNAGGEYVLFIDPDDVIIPGSLKYLLEQALINMPDVLIGDYVKMRNTQIEDLLSGKENREAMFGSQGNGISEVKDGGDYFIQCYNPAAGYTFCNFYKRRFLVENKLTYRPGITFTEDTLFTLHCFLHATRIIRCSEFFYIYRQHSASAMSTMSADKLLSLNTVIAEIYSLNKITPALPAVYLRKVNDCAFFLFTVLLWYLSHYHSLVVQRKNILADLERKVPHLFFRGDLKLVLISLCYSTLPSLYIYIRYIFAKRKY